jgi:transcriptional regulator with XRE-family HTH domain
MGIYGGKMMRDLREAAGREDFELAEKTGISLEDIRALEAGTRKATMEEVRKLAVWLCPKDEHLLYGLLHDD